jgi:hypothetical protein
LALFLPSIGTYSSKVHMEQLFAHYPLSNQMPVVARKIHFWYFLHILVKNQCSIAWPEMEDVNRSGVRAHVFLIIQCTIQISGSVWQTQNGCLFLLV